jgi:hypothetical protein
MLLHRVLVRLPDRPGSLGRVTTLLGRLGIDIHQVRVLSRDGSAAIDEFVLALPGTVVRNCLAELLEEVDGVRVLSAGPVLPALPVLAGLDATAPMAAALPAPVSH